MIFTSFNNRKVCSINVDYDFDELINKINEQSFFIRIEDNQKFNNKIVLINSYKNDHFNFYYCRFGFEMETERKIVNIREDGIFEKDENQIISYALPFWIGDNGLILFKSLRSVMDKKGKFLLSEHLFGNGDYIVENNFDIDAITNAVEEGFLNHMWTSSFSGRHNNVQGGILNGDNVNDDVMFNLTAEATKTSVGILYQFYDEEIKLRFYETGSIQLLTNELEMDNPIMFNLLTEFKDYII